MIILADWGGKTVINVKPVQSVYISYEWLHVNGSKTNHYVRDRLVLQEYSRRMFYYFCLQEKQQKQKKYWLW